MRVLVIPDVHLKPWMFDSAENILKMDNAEIAVCLMDIPDDWNQQRNIDLYRATFDRAIRFAATFKDSLWCYGNHDLSYLWQGDESGYSFYAEETVYTKLKELRTILEKDGRLKYIQRIDNVLFMHGGLTDTFVKTHTKVSLYNDVDAVLEDINSLGRRQMWQNYSPIWLRPQYDDYRMYKPRKLLQVVGHTPMEHIERKGNVISCDVFSTYRDGSPIGTQEYLLIDTKTWEYRGIGEDSYGKEI